MTKVHLLGEVRVFSHETWHLPTIDKRLGLLGYLACQGSWVEREKLAYLFWPEASSERARANLRGLLARTRELPFAHALETEASRVRWNVDCDVRAFEQAVAQEAWDEALGHYGGELLAGVSLEDAPEFSAWLEIEREQLKEARRQAILRRAKALRDLRQGSEALKLIQAYLKEDALDEEALQLYMQLLIESGQRVQALSAYQSFSQRLAEELELGPTSATERLAQAIKTPEAHPVPTDEPPPGPPPAAGESSAPTWPMPLTSFVGRDLELVELTQLLAKPQCRLLTLTGPGGVGKTRLAQQLAQELSEHYPDGVYVVSLESTSSVEAIPASIAKALGLELNGQEGALAEITRSIKGKRLLLVLNNYEHLLEGATLTLELLKDCPELTLIVTSRERLNLSEEWLFPIEGLPYPEDEPPLENARAYDAVRFFLERAEQVQPSFYLSEEALPDVLKICRLVGGLPLGLELSAAWVRAMPLGDLAQELETSFDILSSGSRSLSERHQSIRAAFEHSWRLLTPKEQGLLRRLAVFRGSFSKEAAKYVAGSSLPLLAALVDKSLLRLTPEGRYQRHPLLYQYALEKLDEDPQEAAAVRDCHAGYFVSFAEEAEQRVGTAQQAAWAARLELEHDNLRQVLKWAEESTQAELGLRLAAALKWFWWQRGYVNEGRAWLSRMLTLPSEDDSLARARALVHAGLLANLQSDLEAAQSLYEEGAAMARSLGFSGLIAKALNNLGLIALHRGDYQKARALLEESLAVRCESDAETDTVATLNNLGVIARVHGDYDAARSLHEKSLAISRETGNKSSVANALAQLALIAREAGDSTRAGSLLEESLKVARASEHKMVIAATLHHQGVLARDQGDYRLARSLHGKSLKMRWESGVKQSIDVSFEAIAALKASEGELEQAACLWGAAEAWREATSTLMPPDKRLRYEQRIDALHAKFGKERLQAAWARGKAMPLAEAVAYALEAVEQS